MDHPWRPPLPPPVSGNTSICPICAISHFPFCPPPPFIENPRFHNSQSHTDHFYQRPLFDHHNPFPDRPSSLDYNHNYNPSDGFVDRRPTWHNSHLDLGMPPNGGLRDYPMDNRNYNNYHNGGVGSASYGYDNYDHGAVKRMRVETVDCNRGPSGLFINGENEDSSRFPSAHERIAKLIHDHGNLPNDGHGGFSQTGASLFSESKSDIANGYLHERLIENYGVRVDMGLKRRLEMNDSQNNEHYDRIGELESQYGRIETLPNSLNYRRYSSQQAEIFTDMEHHEQTQGHYGGKTPYHSILQKIEMKKPSPLQQDVLYRTTETLHDNYHNSQPVIPSEAAIIKEPNYSNRKQIVGVNGLLQDRMPSSLQHHSSQPLYGWSESKGHHHQHSSFGTNFRSEDSHSDRVQPPLPASPPPPLPTDQPRNHFFGTLASPPPKNPSLFPIGVNSSAALSLSRPPIPENQSPVPAYYTSKVDHHASTFSSAEEVHTRRPAFENYAREVQPLPLRNLSSRKPNIIDASHIFKQPHRTTRPDHLVIILRGLPGSGKSYLAKMLRDLEVENGGVAPRIHSMDEYFMTEVEKAEEIEAPKSSGSLRGKRPVMKKVMQYCFEPEMEEAYRASMLKAFKKTLDEGVYSFIIVDDRNLRVADFAQFWATAKRSGYEVYLLEASYKDPAGCAARNVHNFTQDDIQKMAGQWEEAPSMYLKLDIKSLLHGDGFDESGIQEVDMDMEDGDPPETPQEFDVKSSENTSKEPVDVSSSQGPSEDAGHPEERHRAEEVKHLSRSKWSNDLDENDSREAEGIKGNASALSGLIQAYSKEGKSVRWGDQGVNVGFSISATKKTNSTSLVIGPGSGYNLKSNPLSEEEIVRPTQNAFEPKRQNVFQERMRAERESFKAVFDKRRQRIGGFNADEE